MTNTLPSPRSDSATTPWSRFGELGHHAETLHQGLERLQLLLDEVSNDGAFIPRADLEETEDAFVVEIDLAGVRRSDIDLTTSGRRLTVEGERKERERVGILRRRTRTVGHFRYEIELPADFEADAVSAGLEDGVLTVRLPKPETDRPRRIPVS